MDPRPHSLCVISSRSAVKHETSTPHQFPGFADGALPPGDPSLRTTASESRTVTLHPAFTLEFHGQLLTHIYI